MASPAETETRIKVFISYSRSDAAFAKDLVLGLAACGFAPYIDQHDIVAGEDWQKRLSGLIAEAHTVVYVVSAHSLASEHCRWEFEECMRLSKRILPVDSREAVGANDPADLKRLHYIRFASESRSFAAGLSDLAAALRTDIGWVREHTRLADLAQRWTGRGRAETLLLRGDDIDQALDWMAARPPRAPEITDAQADFIKASADARAEAERRARRARTGLLTVVSVVAIVMAALAGAAGLAWTNASQAEADAKASRNMAVAANEQLEDASIRLNARVALRVAPNDAGFYDIGETWYPVVANFAGAIARVERSGGGGPGTVHGGFMIDGGLVHPKFADQPLLLSMNIPSPDASAFDGPPVDPGAPPSDRLAPDDPRQPQRMIVSDDVQEGPASVTVSFPVLRAAANVGGEVVWRTPQHLGGELPFELWTLSGDLPRGVAFIKAEDIDCRAFDAIAPHATVAVYSLGIPAAGSEATGANALNISQLIDASDPRTIYYSHATNRATGGSPLFDLDTRKVLAVHYGSSPDPDRPGRRRGEGYSLRMVLDIARSSIADAQLPPLCGA